MVECLPAIWPFKRLYRTSCHSERRCVTQEKERKRTWDPLPIERAECLGKLSDPYVITRLQELSLSVVEWAKTEVASGPCHFMLYGHGAENEPNLPFFNKNHCCEMVEIAKSIIESVCPRSQNAAAILSLRLLISSPGSCAQQWHLDYAGTDVKAQTVFVALTPCTADNCTEVIAFDVIEDEHSLLQEATVSGAEGRPPNLRLSDFAGRHSIVPITMEPLEVCRIATSQTLHRRSRNKSSFTRIVLNIDYSTEEDFNFTCIDTNTSNENECQRLVGEDVVDQLEAGYDVVVLD
eukprot:gnl/MRDRNA2_/MRDRNA2_209569_c0_seq1.p1 gnl/MRDRNA2_/MRDRNA2_209569_c0~~gnl/MRDRNA2_/MRDRNA2_209569_c0_seq1.p1  ORF type:complete len:293 (+),score=49.16 gnl/MRDRNA2_/MRDRNA2_209569_c0_seq1:95-973(+)